MCGIEVYGHTPYNIMMTELEAQYNKDMAYLDRETLRSFSDLEDM